MNGKIVIILFILIVTATIYPQDNLRDVVYLKDGSIIRGIIIEQIHNVSITIQTRDGNIFKYDMDDVLKIVKESVQKEATLTTSMKQKSPLTSFLLSFFIVSSGQFYNGEKLKGLGIAGGFLGGVLILANSSESNDLDKANSSELLGGLIMMGCWAISIIDAPMSSNRMNERYRQRSGHLLEFEQGNHLITFDIGTRHGVLTPTISYQF